MSGAVRELVRSNVVIKRRGIRQCPCATFLSIDAHGRQIHRVTPTRTQMVRAAQPEARPKMAERFTAKQGQYLAFIYNYSVMFGQAPAEADLLRFFGTSPPSVHQMLVTLTEKGWISRIPGTPRSIQLLVDPEAIPRLERPNRGRA